MILIEEINRYGTVICRNHDNVVVAKSCGKCRELKTIYDFHSTPATAIGGTVSTCKSCIKVFHNRHYRKNTQKVYLTNYNEKNEPVSRECSKCKDVLCITQFHKHKKGKDGYNSYCMSCTSKEGSTYRAKVSDKIKERSKTYYKTCKDRIDINNSIRNKTKRNQKEFYKNFTKEMYEIYEQAYEINKGDVKVAVDHIVPLNHPNVCGLHYHLNLRIVDDSVNCSKGNKWDGTNDNLDWKKNWRNSRKKVSNE